MAKISVISVVPNVEQLETAILNLNFNNVQLLAVVLETGNESPKYAVIDNIQVPIFSLRHIEDILTQTTNAIWLISGTANGANNISEIKNFLMLNGVPENNIVNFELLSNIESKWIANLRYIEKYPVEYFATGTSQIGVGLNFKSMIAEHNGGGCKSFR